MAAVESHLDTQTAIGEHVEGLRCHLRKRLANEEDVRELPPKRQTVVRRITRAGDCRPDEAFAGDGEEIPGDRAGASPETIKQVRARRSELRCCCPDNGLGRSQERASFEVSSSSERCGRTVANGRSSRSCWHSESGIMTVTAFRPRPSMTRTFGDLDRTCESSCCRRSRRPSRVNATTYLLCVSFAISAYFNTTMPWSHTFKKTLFVELFIASIAYLARFRSRGNDVNSGSAERITAARHSGYRASPPRLPAATKQRDPASRAASAAVSIWG